MRRPAGVIVAAVILGILALIGILLSVLVFGVSILVRTPIVPNLPAVRFTLAATAAIVFLFSVFCGWTVAGLMRLRPWARYSMMIIGSLQCLACAVLCAGTLLARSYAPPLPPSASAMNLQLVLVGTAAIYGGLSLVGVFWLIYFNLSEIRGVFARSSSLRPGEEAATGSPGELPGSSLANRPPQIHDQV